MRIIMLNILVILILVFIVYSKYLYVYSENSDKLMSDL